MKTTIDFNYIEGLLNKVDDILEKNEEVEEVTEVKAEEVKEEVKEEAKGEYDEIVKEKLEAVKNLEGIEIELIGYWIWISGDTYNVKDEIKEAGFKYAKNKKMWYFNPNINYKKRSRKIFTKEEMEELHGFIKIK